MTPKTARGMGRGLSALLGEDANVDDLRKPVGYINKDIVGHSVPQTVEADIVRIPMDLIEPNPFQPRMQFDSESLSELAESIKSLGLIQPITVRKVAAGKYQIISGERRYRAAKMAGMDMIPSYIRDASEQGMLEMAIVENIQRENLDPIEVAMSYQRLIDECSLTQEQMADRVGKKRASVTNYLRLLKLPAKIQHDLKVGMISVGHAKVILGVEDTLLQEQLCDAVVREDLSVRALEQLLAKGAKPAEKKKADIQQDLPENYYKVLERVGKYFGENISLKRNKGGKGTITIHFSSDAEIDAFLKDLERP